MSEAGREARVKRLAREAGFDLCGIASLAAPPPRLGELLPWLEKGRQGEMAWLERQAEKRLDPGLVLPGARSLICVGLVYNTAHPYSTDLFPLEGRSQRVPPAQAGKGWVSRYAWGEDYHKVMERKLRRLEEALRAEFPGAGETRAYCDTGPLSEKAWAAAAGLGWQGKHTNLINAEKGSWFFLGEILTALELAPDAPEPDRCGTCTRCLEACPTQAFPRAYELDASRCLSYLSIEKRGELDPELAAALGANLYGCDICQDVCPWNRGRVLSAEPAFEPRAGLLAPELDGLERISEADFAERFRGSAMKRAKAAGLRRNAALSARSPARRAAGPAPEGK